MKREYLINIDWKTVSTSPNKQVSGSGFQPSLKSPSATSDTCQTSDCVKTLEK